MELQFQSLFSRETGNADNYRIPALITAGNRVIAVADERFFTAGDNPNRIDKVIRISDDSGNTWGKQSTIVEEVGESKLRSSAAIDPALLYASATDTLFLLYSHTPAGIGILNSRQTTGYTKKGQTLIGNGKKYYIKDHRIYRSDDTATDWSIDDQGYVRDSVNTVLGNVRAGDFVLREEPTSYLMLTRSTDGGVTWDTPVCLNQQVKKPNWGFIGAGPGIGIEVKQGKYKGRLVFPIYYGTHRFPPACNAAALYSDDNGLTWIKGENAGTGNECEAAELDDGTLVMVIRDMTGCSTYHPEQYQRLSYSDDGGETWYEQTVDTTLRSPICMSSVDVCGNTLYLTFPDDYYTRANLTVAYSEDGGETFEKKVLYDGPGGYSCVTSGGNGKVFVIAEVGKVNYNEALVFFRIDIMR